MPTHVTAVKLSTDTDEHGQVWRLDWTENDGRRDTTWTKTHHAEAAARRHATGLCAKRPPGTATSDIFTDARGYPVPGPDGSSL